MVVAEAPEVGAAAEVGAAGSKNGALELMDEYAIMCVLPT